MAGRLLSRPASIGFHRNADMPALLRSGDLLVHPSIADLESVSVIEGMAAGLVPVIASSSLSAAGQFALLDESLFPVDDVDALAVVSTGGSTIRRSSPSGAAPTPNIRKPIIRWNRPYVSSSRWNVRRSPITVAEWRLPQSQYNRYT